MYRPKRVRVPSLKVKRLIKLFDSSPSKMDKGKKTGASAGAVATKSAAALARMAEELGKEEAAANDQAAPAANTSSMGMVAAAVCDLFVPGAKNRDSVLVAKVDQQRRHSCGEGTAAAGTLLVAGDIQSPNGSAPALSGVARTP
jgi:hypothetical protein